MLEDLGGTIGIALQKPLDHRLEAIQLARAGTPRTPGNVIFGPRIFGCRFGIQPECERDLLEVEPLLLVHVPDLAACLVVDHGLRSSFILRRNSLMRVAPSTTSPACSRRADCGGGCHRSTVTGCASTLWAFRLLSRTA